MTAREVLDHYREALKHRKSFLREQVKRADMFGDDEMARDHKRSLYSQIGWVTRRLSLALKEE